ncbi:cyclase family protein [Chloroflexi bacterium TSY]|nr:cyclase family protein [Chloroflexi bacterium TSY]
MPQLIDLTIPIVDHFRWPVERTLTSDFADGAQFQVTRMGWVVHGFTHIDAPRHMVPGGPTTSELALEQVIGRAAVVDLSVIEPQTPITAEMLATAGQHIEPDGIVLLKSCWDQVVSYQTPEFWKTAPYVTRDGAEWLLSQRIRAIGYDFPQDYPIRLLLDNVVAPIHEHVTHDVLLRNGVVMIEYLQNMALAGPYTQLYALPLKIPDADGAPARVIAVEEMENRA